MASLGDLIRVSNPRAKKEYHCDASAVFHNGSCAEDLPDEDVQGYVAAQLDGFKILPGQRYIKHVYKDGGELCTYRGRPDMDAICTKHQLWEE